MKTLSQTWFSEGRIDFELKKYTLLAYLQDVHRSFQENRIFPSLSDLRFHYHNLVELTASKHHLKENFPKRLQGISWENLQLLYEELQQDDQVMEELGKILDFAEFEFKRSLDEGKERVDLVEKTMQIEPVGLLPLDNHEGYFFLASSNRKSSLVYHYRLSLYEDRHEPLRAVKTNFVCEWQRSISCNEEQMKGLLIREKKELPNPAVYTIHTTLSFPLEETLLPIARRCLVRYIS